MGIRAAMSIHESLFTAELHGDSYECFRICMCAAVGAISNGIGAIVALPYWLCCGKYRKEEIQKTHMYLTRSSIVLDRFVYQCGCCCYKQVSSPPPRLCCSAHTTGRPQERKTVPLEKVQDVALSTDCELRGCCDYTTPLAPPPAPTRVGPTCPPAQAVPRVAALYPPAQSTSSWPFKR